MQNVLKNAARIREGLLGNSGNVSFRDFVAQDAEFSKVFSVSDTASDMALVFSEFTPDGEVLPLDWVPQLERVATEPMTVVRVSIDMVNEVRKALS